ncbi:MULTISPECIES: NADP-dependent phosphogluconate dehydrogenase [Pedobacter]|jgi:6-phosphogluconate dehydrogenase, decarboxylating|uniref:NADP-dependent phosphogluconate dehydrogenase n=1 Tax=Pedobacter TaxID=84567 RepID=UPI0003E50F41|nr:MULTISPECIES: NADP-dependent phosphogluconate dehydrogenase [Pedobacter]ETZ23711.1 6-phosphogluconate dehydrogenase [Pedobacter sp. V48]NQX57071.1 NADP-dependent phosphogluconate dehydrogenase [Pedobacter panaciterrae]
MKNKYTLGMIGLGTMGRNLLLNMADNGFQVTGYDKDARMLKKLEEDGKAHNLKGFESLEDFIQSLELPRRIMLLVPAGKIVDSVIQELVPLLDKGDMIIDSGNSHFTDTSRRAIELSDQGIHFFGMGISGGEEGARFGPSMMPGGDKAAYNAVKPILEAVSAKVNGDPCVAYIGPGASGHFVKMVHNGIEYSMMQILAETYDLLKNVLGYNNEQIYNTFEKWNNGRLKSFLLEVTRDIFKVKDKKTGGYLIDVIKDQAKSKGTGKWTSQVSMDLQLPIPTINESVSARDLSKFKELRVALSQALPHQQIKVEDAAAFEVQLEQALYFAMITSYAQGLHLLEQASAEFKYELNLKEISQIWRGGCIIRAVLLEDIYQAYKKQPELPHLYSDESIQNQLKEIIPGTRNVVITALKNGIAIPCFASALTYYDSLRTDKSPLNLTQAQRDFFGAHTFERIDEEGIFHADWNENN